jgi:hypothetical protein
VRVVLALAAFYVVGVAWGLMLIDAGPLAKIGLALMWPIGPITFLFTVGILLVAALIVYPLFAAAVLGVGSLIWLAL